MPMATTHVGAAAYFWRKKRPSYEDSHAEMGLLLQGGENFGSHTTNLKVENAPVSFFTLARKKEAESSCSIFEMEKIALN